MPANMKKAGIKYQKGGGILSKIFGKKKKPKSSKVQSHDGFMTAEKASSHKAWVKKERAKINESNKTKAEGVRVLKAENAAKRAVNKALKKRNTNTATDKKNIEKSDKNLSNKMDELKRDYQYYQQNKSEHGMNLTKQKMQNIGSAGPYKNKVQIYGKPRYQGTRKNERTNSGAEKHWEQAGGEPMFNEQGARIPGMRQAQSGFEGPGGGFMNRLRNEGIGSALKGTFPARVAGVIGDEYSQLGKDAYTGVKNIVSPPPVNPKTAPATRMAGMKKGGSKKYKHGGSTGPNGVL